jgi:hypothetical protein
MTLSAGTFSQPSKTEPQSAVLEKRARQDLPTLIFCMHHHLSEVPMLTIERSAATLTRDESI